MYIIFFVLISKRQSYIISKRQDRLFYRIIADVGTSTLYIFAYSYKNLLGAYQKVNHIFILSTDSYSQKEFQKDS